MAYRDSAITAFNNRVTEEEAALAAEKDAFNTKAKQLAVPLFKDSTGTLVIPQSSIAALKNDFENRLVVLKVNDGSVTNDGSPITFAIYPDTDEKYLIKNVDGEWMRGPKVKDLDDVGEVLAGGEW